jgi:hypothetical protein
LDPVEFYQFGLKIIGGSPAPGAAACRSATSRAYFAALNRADQSLARLGASCGKGPQKHGLAVRLHYATDDQDLQTASTTLDDLKSLRNKADYDMNDTSTETVVNAKKALQFAKEVMDDLQAVENDPARRAAAENNIKLYRRKTNTP